VGLIAKGRTNANYYGSHPLTWEWSIFKMLRYRHHAGIYDNESHLRHTINNNVSCLTSRGKVFSKRGNHQMVSLSVFAFNHLPRIAHPGQRPTTNYTRL